MSRWTYNTDIVTVGPNSQKVRQLTWGEQTEYHDKWKKGDQPTKLPALIVSFGAIEPAVTEEDLQSMPPELMQACFRKILQLTGVDVSDKADEPAVDAETSTPAEKKENSSPTMN